jgi:SpoVK/Ycf46/Vps4 family AAA+-type ATPase
MVGADLRALVQTAARSALRRALAGRPEAGRIVVEARDFIDAFAERRTSDAARGRPWPAP